MSDWFFDQWDFTSPSDPRPTTGGRFAALGKFLVLSVAMGVISSIAFIPAAVLPAAAGRGAWDFWNGLPSDLPAQPLPQQSVILDKNGEEIARFFSEDRVNVKLSQVAPVMRDAIVSIEDTRFYDHGAVDWRGLAKAVASNGDAGGGSTLTQQYVKNVRMYNANTDEERDAATEATYRRKITEMRYAVALEQKLSKDQILEGYLNIANFGDGSYGIGAASLHYFGVPASKLTLPQAAMIAGMVQNPEAYNPVKHPETAKKRRDTVLMRMRETGRASAAAVAKAQDQPLGLKVTTTANGCSSSAYPFYCQMVRDQLRYNPVFGTTQAARDRFLYRGGLTIRTNLDPAIQRIADSVAKRAMGQGNSFATALAVVQPGTGHILGIGQSRTWDETQVNLSTARFQNGSTFKPITLAAAMETGWPVDKVINAKGRYCAPAPNTGCFKNMSPWDAGPMNAADALAVSSNTFFTELSVITGTDKVQDMARRLGWKLPDGLTGHETSTTLGVYDVSTVTVANAYATFAAHGVYCAPTAISSIVDSRGKAVAVPQANCHQEIAPAIADTVAKALTTPISGSNPHRTAKAMDIGRPAMGKTGTTEGNSAIWFAGGIPQATIAVWVGDPKGGFDHPVESLRLYGEWVGAVYGGTGSGPIWRGAMSKVAARFPKANFSNPSVASPAVKTMPNFVGMSPDAAVALAHANGLTPKIAAANAAASENFPANVVAAQSISVGSRMPGSGEVVLTLSAGSAKAQVATPPLTTADKPVGNPEVGGGITTVER